MDDLPGRFADALESIAARIRSQTADRLESWIRAALLLVVTSALASIGLVLILVTFHRLLSPGLGSAGSLTLLGGLFLIAGLFIWRGRRRRSKGSS